MPLVAKSPPAGPKQQARSSTPQPLQVWLAVSCLAFPIPATLQAVPHPSQRCLAMTLVLAPVSVRAPAPFELVSVMATKASLHLGQAMTAEVALTAAAAFCCS